eukprot:340120-Hanusia_phi.AAC.3
MQEDGRAGVGAAGGGGALHAHQESPVHAAPRHVAWREKRNMAMHSTERNLREDHDEQDFWDKLWHCAGYAQTQDGEYVRMQGDERERQQLSMSELQALIDEEMVEYYERIEEKDNAVRSQDREEDWSKLLEYARLGDLHKAMARSDLSWLCM